jgi:hypothetical protein
MMIAADLVKKIRESLWCKAVNCANDMENVSASTVRGMLPAAMITGAMSKLCPMLQPFRRIGRISICKKFKSTWKEKSVKHLMVGYAKNHSAGTYRMCNLKTNAVSELRDLNTWAEWKKDMSVFNKDPKLLIEPMGLDAVEVTEPLKTNKAGFHMIPDDDDSEAGRKKPVEPSEDTSKSNEASTAAAAADAAAEASNYKARKLERELKKLDSNWNPIDKTAMDAPVVFETEEDGKEKARIVHFVFNTELMTEHGDPNLQGSYGRRARCRAVVDS